MKYRSHVSGVLVVEVPFACAVAGRTEQGGVLVTCAISSAGLCRFLLRNGFDGLLFVRSDSSKG